MFTKRSPDMSYKQCLLKAVVSADYNQEEKNYIEKTINHILKKLSDDSREKLELFVQTVQESSTALEFSECITLPRSSVIICKELNVAQNLRVKGDNRFVSGKLQWLSVLLSKIFRFPEIQFQHDLEAAPHCHFHFGKKLESICINVQHYTPVEVATQQTIQQCSIPLSIQQPVIYQIVDENFRSSGNETVVYQVFNQSTPIQSSQTPIMPKMKQVYQLAPAAHSPSSGSTPMALSPIVSSNPITEIFNLQEEANVRYEKIASTWDQSTDDAWASIQYNKGTQSIGQKFICKNAHRQIILDNAQRNSDLPCPQRFSLGEFQNRSSIEDEIFAAKIGKGVGLVNVKGQIFVDNLTKGPIFSQSWTGTEYVNKQYDANLHRSTIMEIKAGLVGVCIFDLEIFAKDLDECARRLQRAKDENNLEAGRRARIELNRMQHRCLIRISLFTGWGEQHHSKAIQGTPHWIEIKAFTALNWLDASLLSPPKFDSGYECSSVSKAGSNSDKNSVDSKSTEALPWWRKLFKKREKQPKICPVGCSCLCHTEKPIKSVAIDMALLTANANQLRILMGMEDLCGKINWEQTRLLEDGTSVPTGCDVRQFTWKCLLFLVLVSILGQILVGVVNTCIFSFIQYPNKNLIARSVNSISLMLAFFITCVNIVMTGIFAG
ncbi:Oidioi.mRNA.OKI2018_I69.XSR.g15099.t1.cds [Oikopleura dioica]|uniref:Mothers against decapentaplegic homolog n=1 Tax=Oikopleura dioica TaxID=34765 RepID=A0ABN7SJ49_OIKDI|nr:Oidioi.mRNA.OKI2018_I69.XSR.g15099.t1.cds [Oikopleura dioica]